MTKLSYFRKNEKKLSKRQTNEKIYIFEFDDNEDNFGIGKTFKSRIPSRQQYKRLKNKSFGQNFNHKKLSENRVVKNGTKNKEQLKIEIRARTPKLSNVSDESSMSPPHSALSFHIQPDWSDFEDTEHFQFVSELDVDLSKVFKHFEDKQIIDIGVYDDLCIMDDGIDSNLSIWATDLSSHRHDHAISTICFLEDIIKSNYTSIFSLNFKPKIWQKSLSDANGLLIFCESNKYLFQDLMTKEYSIAMQNNCLKWTELGTRCSILKSCLEKIVNFEHGKLNLDTALCVLHEQCLSIMDHGLIYPDPLVIRIVEGIKKIMLSLKTQFNGVKMILDDLFGLSDKCCTTLLDQVEKEITILERDEKNEQLKSVVESLGMYLGKESKWIQEPVLNFCF